MWLGAAGTSEARECHDIDTIDTARIILTPIALNTQTPHTNYSKNIKSLSAIVEQASTAPWANIPLKRQKKKKTNPKVMYKKKKKKKRIE